MANIFKASEAYKKVPNKILQTKPLVTVHGLYIAGLYRPPYWIKPIINVCSIGGSRAADVAYYTSISTEMYSEKDGILFVKNMSFIDDISYVDYSVSSYAGYVEPEGILFADNVSFVGDISVMSYTRASVSGYTEPNGILFVNDVSLIGNISYIDKETEYCEQPPGYPVLNLYDIGSSPATVTNTQ